MPSNPLIHLCKCDCGFCCCRGYEPQAVVTGAEAPCTAVNTTYSVNEPFSCEVSGGTPGVCTWIIGTGGEYPYVQIQYAPAAYFPLILDENRWKLLVARDVGGAFLTAAFPSYLTCAFSDIAGKYMLYGTNELDGVGDCAGQTIDLTIS